MTSITTNVKHRVRTTGLEHQGQTSISDPDHYLGCTCIFSAGMHEKKLWGLNTLILKQRHFSFSTFGKVFKEHDSNLTTGELYLFVQQKGCVFPIFDKWLL